MEDGNEKKKYHVVDKRMSLDEEESPAESAAEHAAPAAQAAHAAPAEAHEEGGADENEGPGEMRINDAMRMVLSMVRERVFLSLGLVVSKHRPKEKSMTDAENLSNLFGALADGFFDKLGGDELGDTGGGKIPSTGELIEFCFGMMQGQILIRLGLVADPATGLIAKDLEQARQGIDFCAAMLSNAGEMITPDQARRFEGVLSDLRINYVSIVKQG